LNLVRIRKYIANAEIQYYPTYPDSIHVETLYGDIRDTVKTLIDPNIEEYAVMSVIYELLTGPNEND
jgi:hypothetical protein